MNFKLFANCIPVRGFKRSVICDLQRQEVELIPNDLYDILVNQNNLSVEEIKRSYNNKYDTIIQEYFDFLVEKEFIFYTEQPNLFPKLSTSWFSNSVISNSIIEINSNSDYDLLSVIKQLNNLNCKFIEVRFYNISSINILIDLLKTIEINKYSIISIDVLIQYSKKNKNKIYKNLFEKYPRLSFIKVFNASENKLLPIITCEDKEKYILFSKVKIKDNKHCGQISKDFFAVNIDMYTESLNFNSCLNRKLSIDVNGKIKNCPSMIKIFGDVRKDLLEEVIYKDGFKKYWDISKDQIDICKDCEFRYICSDCRAYKDNPNDDYSKPLKCGYNPFTNKWEKWSNSKLKESAIKFYQLEDLVRT